MKLPCVQGKYIDLSNLCTGENAVIIDITRPSMSCSYIQSYFMRIIFWGMIMIGIFYYIFRAFDTKSSNIKCFTKEYYTLKPILK